MKASLGKSPGSGLLKEFSPWLAGYHKEDYPKHIEVPGQYDGLSRPRPESNACISSFDSRILVLSSLRKPKRITVRADNELEYSFLVKGGEDLRQDQRIEQLFAIMNGILEQDQACSQRNMRLRTYQVITIFNFGLVSAIIEVLFSFVYSHFSSTKSVKSCLLLKQY